MNNEENSATLDLTSSDVSVHFTVINIWTTVTVFCYPASSLASIFSPFHPLCCFRLMIKVFFTRLLHLVLIFKPALPLSMLITLVPFPCHDTVTEVHVDD